MRTWLRLDVRTGCDILRRVADPSLRRTAPAYYASPVAGFLESSPDAILGRLATGGPSRLGSRIDGDPGLALPFLPRRGMGEHQAA